jgi:integrase
MTTEKHTLRKGFANYKAEHVGSTNQKRFLKRVETIEKHACEIWGEDRDLNTMKRNDGRYFVEQRLAKGVKPATARRDLTIIGAMMRHEKKEERITNVPSFQMPAASSPRIRFLTEEEHGRLMESKLPPRLRKFFIVAFLTGARSEAIEQLTWDRVNLEHRTIDFRVPGVAYRNKRRVIVPISDALLPHLQGMNDWREDEHVIGAGCSTYHQAKAALRGIGIDERGVARHVARHTFASWRVQRGVPLFEIAQLMGDTVAMVEKTYAHLLPHHLMNAANNVKVTP